MQISNQMLSNQIKKIYDNSNSSSNSDLMKAGSVFSARVANIYDGLLTLEISPKVYIEAKDTTGANYKQGETIDFVVINQDENGKVLIKALDDESLEFLEQKNLKEVVSNTGLVNNKENVEIAKQLILNKLPVTDENIKLLSSAKAQFNKVISLMNDKEQKLVLTNEKLDMNVKSLLIEQLKSSNPSKMEQQVVDKNNSIQKNELNSSLDSLQTSKNQSSNELNLSEKVNKNFNEESLKIAQKENFIKEEVTTDKEMSAERPTNKTSERLVKEENENLITVGKDKVTVNNDKPELQISKYKDNSEQDKNMIIKEEIAEKLGAVVNKLDFEKLVFLLKNNLDFSLNNAMVLEKIIVGTEKLSDQFNNLVENFEKDGISKETIKLLDDILKGFELNDNFDKNKVQNQIKMINELIEKTETEYSQKGTSENVKSILSEIKQSVDFISQLNNQITYLQLPFTLNDYPNNFEVFVQRDKSGNKAINPKDTKLFISLNTNHLSLVQVLIEIKDKSIGFNFRIDNDKIKKLISSNENILIPAIENVGFENINFKYAISDEKMNIANMVRLDSSETINKIDVRI